MTTSRNIITIPLGDARKTNVDLVKTDIMVVGGNRFKTFLLDLMV